MASTDELCKRVEELEDIVRKCYNQIEVLNEKVFHLEKERQSQPSRRICSSHNALKRNKRTNNNDIDSSSSDGSFNIKDTRTKGLFCSKDVYQEVLQENHKSLLEDLDLTNTHVLDRLISDDVVSVSDKDCIKSKSTTKDITRELLLKLATYGEEKFHKFCSAIAFEYPPLSQKLRDSFRKKLSGKEINDELKYCLYCKLRDHVEPRDVIDELYSRKVVNVQTTKLIMKEKNPDIAWNEIRHHINGRADHFRVLCDVLRTKYQHIQTEFVENGINTLKCTCAQILKQQITSPFNKLGVSSSSNRSSCTSIGSAESTAEISEPIQSLQNWDADIAPAGEKAKYGSLDSQLIPNLTRYLTDVEHRNDFNGNATFDKIKFYSLPPRLCAKSRLRNPNSTMNRVGEENSDIEDCDTQSNLNSISTNVEDISDHVNGNSHECSHDNRPLLKDEDFDNNFPNGCHSRQNFNRRAFKKRKKEPVKT